MNIFLHLNSRFTSSQSRAYKNAKTFINANNTNKRDAKVVKHKHFETLKGDLFSVVCNVF